MKVLHIIDHLGLGGAQTTVKTLFEAQFENDKIFLFALRKVKPEILVQHSSVFFNHSNSRYSFSPLFKLADLIRKEEIEVLHCHLPRSQVFGYLLKVFLFPDIKLIFQEQGDIFENTILAFLFRLFQKKVNVFIACSNITQVKLIERAGIDQGKMVVLYNCIDLNKFDNKSVVSERKRQRAKLDISESDFVVGFAARIIRRKGWEEFIDAAGQMKSKYPVKFIIAGEGDERKQMEAYIRNQNLEGMVIVMGYVSDMVGFYSMLDLFVIPSHWEPMGLTEVEAQAMGIPIICSNVPGLNEIIMDKYNGLLCQPQHPGDLSSKIMALVENALLRNELIRNGLNSVKQYSQVLYLETLLTIYKSAIAQSAPPVSLLYKK